MKPVTLPAETVQAAIATYGNEGAQWAQGHGQVLADIIERWSLQLGDPMPGGLPHNIVFAATRGAEQLVLKTGYPHIEQQTEMRVLQRWQGLPARVALQAFDSAAGVVLLKRVLPGTSFRQANLATRSSHIPPIHEMMPLPVLPDDQYPTYEQWCDQAFTSVIGLSCPDGFVSDVSRARELLDSLIHGQQQCLLHGDLHHENMLLSNSGDYVAIDPKGVIGPALLEYGRFMHNFIDDEVSGRASIACVLQQRADSLAGRFSAMQLLTAGYVDLVLSCCWTINSGQALRPHAHDILAALRGLLH